MTNNEIHSRALSILHQMTLEEKAAQMVQVPYTMVGREEALRWAKLGAGSFLHVLGDNAREIQQAALHSRLGIPVIFGIDAIHGHGLNDHAAIFPSQLASACAWDREVVRTMGEDTAREVATDGLHWTFSPVLCLGRDTRWGRIDETFGEDPYLAGELGAAIVRGYQGDDISDDEHILACAKHYLGYGEATGARDAIDTEVTERKIREVFLPVFRKAVEAGCGSIMTAYGSIDGVPLTANRRIMKEILRGELGFDGFVVTDWDNVRSLVTNQHVAKDIGDASVMAAEAGNDMMMTTLGFYDAILKAVREGKVAESVLDEAVEHILTVKLRMGLFEKPEKKGRPGSIGCEKHRADALNAARRSVTLLKNSGVLPVSSDIKKIAVIGANADDIEAQYGDWTYFTHPAGAHMHKKAIRPYVTLKEGIEAICAEQGISCAYAYGCGPEESERDDLGAAVAAAKNAGLIILAVGDNWNQHGEYKDRADLSLSGKQNELFAKLRALNIPIVTVLISSKPLCLGDAAEKADAVITGFNGGQFGGQAMAEAIFGRLNPQGRLPISFPRHSGQLPVHYMAAPGWHGDKYWDLPKTPLFAFGEGMGYADFACANLTVDADLTVRVDVTNTGKIPGTETVQVYLHDIVSSVITPVKRLAAFQKVDLAPGETKTVSIPLTRNDFSLVNARCERVVEPGEFEVMVGHSSKDEDLASVTISIQ